MRKEVSNDYWMAIWTRFKTGDPEAFAVLYNYHIDSLYNYGAKLCKDSGVVKDSLQDIFLELFQKHDKIKISHEYLRFYLLLALKRKLIKKLKADRKISHLLNKELDFYTEYSIEFQIMEREKNAEIDRKVTNALQHLSSKQKEVIYLRFNESLGYNEIASILDINIESVRKQVHRALKTVREIIGNELITALFVVFIKK